MELDGRAHRWMFDEHRGGRLSPIEVLEIKTGFGGEQARKGRIRREARCESRFSSAAPRRSDPERHQDRTAIAKAETPGPRPKLETHVVQGRLLQAGHSWEDLGRLIASTYEGLGA